MKKFITVGIVGIMFLLYGNNVIAMMCHSGGGGGGHQHEEKAEKKTKESFCSTVYACPMHPEVQSDKSGKCPKCGMKLEKRKNLMTYACPEKDCNHQSAKPGKCPEHKKELIKCEVKPAEKPSKKKLGLCPVMPTEEASAEYSYVYKGRTYYFCCGDCLVAFKKSPGKYVSRIKEISLEAYQYGFSPDPVVVKKGDIVRLTITSRDIAHGVYINEYGVKLPVKKGEKKQVEFFADKSGKFDIICSVYCGPGHSKMRGKFIVEK
ncbi:MAG: heavy metal-binding domain-containing protein [Elusimicrobiota bacterium]